MLIETLCHHGFTMCGLKGLLGRNVSGAYLRKKGRQSMQEYMFASCLVERRVDIVSMRERGIGWMPDVDNVA
jgi:hypothetical protein